MSQWRKRQSSRLTRANRWFRTARRLVRGDCYEAALAALDRALALTPTAELADYRGVVLALIDRVQEAVAAYEQALLLACTPTLQAQIYFHRGLLYGREQAYEQALLDFSRAAMLHPAERSYREALETLEREYAAVTDTPV